MKLPIRKTSPTSSAKPVSAPLALAIEGAQRAIARSRDAMADLEATVKARDLAAGRRRGAANRLEELNQARADFKPDAGAFVTSVDAGEPLSVEDLLQHRDRGTAEAEAAQRDVTAYEVLLTDLDAMILEKQKEVQSAAYPINDAVKEVVRNSSVVEPLIEGMLELQRNIAARRAALTYLYSGDLISESEKVGVKAVLDDVRTLDHPHGTFYEIHPACAAWKQAVEALKSDPTLPLPTIQSGTELAV